MKSQLSRLFPRADEILYDLLGIFQPKAGSVYHSIYLQYSPSTFANAAADRLRATYFPMFRKLRFDQIIFYVAGAGGAGAKVRLGVYSDENFYPKELLLDAGEVSAESTGRKNISINITLDKGRYWLAAISNDGTIDWCHTSYSLSAFIRDSIYQFGHVYVDIPYGALPDPFPTGGALGTTAWFIRLRVAEVF